MVVVKMMEMAHEGPDNSHRPFPVCWLFALKLIHDIFIISNKLHIRVVNFKKESNKNKEIYKILLIKIKFYTV